MPVTPDLNLVPDYLIAENKSDPIRRISLALDTLAPDEREHNLTQVIDAIREDDPVRLAVNRPDDIKVAATVGEVWQSRAPVPVGESGTILRVFSYRDEDDYQTWRAEPRRTFIRTGTLATRSITPTADIYGLSQTELLKIDNGTSQYASAAVLCGDQERLPDAPFRLQQTYDIYDQWLANGRQLDWGAPLIEDETLRLQAEAVARAMVGKDLGYEVRHSEEVPLGVAIGVISLEEATKRFSSVLGHESNRIVEMKRGLELYRSGEPITNNDHRVVQALAWLALIEDRPIQIVHPNSVAKSWPLYWECREFVAGLK